MLCHCMATSPCRMPHASYGYSSAAAAIVCDCSWVSSSDSSPPQPMVRSASSRSVLHVLVCVNGFPCHVHHPKQHPTITSGLHLTASKPQAQPVRLPGQQTTMECDLQGAQDAAGGQRNQPIATSPANKYGIHHSISQQTCKHNIAPTWSSGIASA